LPKYSSWVVEAVLAAQPPTHPAAGVPSAHASGGRPTRPPTALQTTTDAHNRY